VALRFGDFLFDGEARELRRGGETVPLSPKALDLLRALLEACPRALSRQELQDRLWPDTHVTHTSLPRVVNELRQALGDDPKEPRFVRTAHKYGYAFRAAGTPEEGAGARAGSGAEPPPALVPFSLLWGGRQIPLVEGETTIGRDPQCTVRVDSPKVSRHHARIRVTRFSATIEDLGSKNGTKVGGARVQGETPLSDGDEIVIGPTVLLFWRSGPGSTETAAND
jgi:DNA-binding winged helix-turn-helix (wHTH) protein